MGFDDIASFLFTVGKTAHDQINAALESAYQRGVEDGRRMAAEEFKARISDALNIPMEPSAKSSETPPVTRQEKSASRAPRGSVEPAVIEALRISVRGKKPSEIAAEKGIPENSVRGMLNKLRHEGVAEKRGELWFLMPQKNEPAGTPSQDAPTGSKPDIFK